MSAFGPTPLCADVLYEWSLVDGEVERRDAVEGVPVDVVGVDVGAALDKHAHHVVVAAVGCQVQRRLLVAPELRMSE